MRQIDLGKLIIEERCNNSPRVSPGELLVIATKDTFKVLNNAQFSVYSKLLIKLWEDTNRCSRIFSFIGFLYGWIFLPCYNVFTRSTKLQFLSFIFDQIFSLVLFLFSHFRCLPFISVSIWSFTFFLTLILLSFIFVSVCSFRTKKSEGPNWNRCDR